MRCMTSAWPGEAWLIFTLTSCARNYTLSFSNLEIFKGFSDCPAQHQRHLSKFQILQFSVRQR